MTKMIDCKEMKSKLADVLFDSEAVTAEVTTHLTGCAECRDQLAELRATMSLLDTWEAPEPNPYFLTRLNARLEEERQAAPASWFEKLRARLAYGPRMALRPVAAMAMTVVFLVGGGAYLGLNDWDEPTVEPTTTQASVVHDLQALDNNAQLLDQLESLSN